MLKSTQEFEVDPREEGSWEGWVLSVLMFLNILVSGCVWLSLLLINMNSGKKKNLPSVGYRWVNKYLSCCYDRVSLEDFIEGNT